MKLKAFTLVELIVVITILAILGTIGFISIQNYTKDSRDSVRISDMSNMKKVLELNMLKNGKYVNPSEIEEITYSGTIAWTQGIFGESVVKELKDLGEIPLDPLTKTPYTYSLTNDKKKYQLGGLLETELSKLNLTETRANEEEFNGYAKIDGNYEGEITKSSGTNKECLLAVPSIITSSGTSLEEISRNNYFVYDRKRNLPKSFKTSKYNLLKGKDTKLVNEDNLELYCGDLENLKSNQDLRVDILENIQKAYSGTQIEKSEELEEILKHDLDINNPSLESKKLVNESLESILNINLPITSTNIPNGCLAGTITGTNATYSYTGLSHLGTGIGNGTKTLTHGTQTYQANLTCNNGTVTIDTENYVSTSCDLDYYNSGDNLCTAVGTGYYSTEGSSSRTACRNKPSNSNYTSDGNGTNSCSWSCNGGFTQSGNSCVQSTGIWKYNSITCYTGKAWCSPGSNTSCTNLGDTCSEYLELHPSCGGNPIVRNYVCK